MDWKKIYLRLAVVSLCVVPNAVFAAGVTGVGTDTLHISHDFFAVLTAKANGVIADATSQNPYNPDYTYFAGFNTSALRFVDSDSGDYVQCSTEGYDSCLANGRGFLIGSPLGYRVVDGLWEEAIPAPPNTMFGVGSTTTVLGSTFVGGGTILATAIGTILVAIVGLLCLGYGVKKLAQEVTGGTTWYADSHGNRAKNQRLAKNMWDLDHRGMTEL